MKTIILSLGGSVLVPHKININFLKKFKKLILKNLKNHKFIIVAGGGKTARAYIKAAGQITKLKKQDLDWLGIHATRLNAHLLRTIFAKVAYQRIIKNPKEKIKFKHLLIASGWKPGSSTDYDAVLLAQTYGIKEIINITCLDYLHDKNPQLYKKTKIIKKTNWSRLRKIVGDKWQPGLSVPFDPIAAQLAQKLKLKLILIGPSLTNFAHLLKGKKFKGSIIQD